MSDQARPELHLDEKWDKVINSMFSRSAMGGLAGAVAGFLLFSALLFRNSTCCHVISLLRSQAFYTHVCEQFVSLCGAVVAIDALKAKGAPIAHVFLSAACSAGGGGARMSTVTFGLGTGVGSAYQSCNEEVCTFFSLTRRPSCLQPSGFFACCMRCSAASPGSPHAVQRTLRSQGCCKQVIMPALKRGSTSGHKHLVPNRCARAVDGTSSISVTRIMVLRLLCSF